MTALITELVDELSAALLQRKWKLVTAESCTGGGLAYFLTEKPGSSQWFERGYVTYSNEAKQTCLNVPETVLKKYGAVSKETAEAMAKGALKNSTADISIAITGIAGPDGGTQEKPVGTVWFAIGTKNKTESYLSNLNGDRKFIRKSSIIFGLQTLINGF